MGSEPCSDPLCCWNAPGRPFFIILASLFLHFCVAARYKEQLFNKKTNKGGSRKELKIISKRTRKMRPILGGGALMKHFPSAVHWETREAALPRRRRLGYLARQGSTRSWHGTARDVPVINPIRCHGQEAHCTNDLDSRVYFHLGFNINMCKKKSGK